MHTFMGKTLTCDEARMWLRRLYRLSAGLIVLDIVSAERHHRELLIAQEYHDTHHLETIVQE